MRKTLILWALLVAMFVAIYSVVATSAPRKSEPLAYRDLIAQWDAKSRSFRSNAAMLYDRAELDYFAKRLQLRRIGSPEVWRVVHLDSRKQMTGDFLGKLESISGFKRSPATEYLAAGTDWPSLLGLLVGFVVLGMMNTAQARADLANTRAAEAATAARLTAPAIYPGVIAAGAIGLIYALHEKTLPDDWLTGVRNQLFEQGLIPYMIVWFTFFGFLCLLQLRSAYGREEYWKELRRRTIDRLVKLFYRDGDISAVQRLRDEILEDRERTIHLAFTTVRYTEWVLPLLGFLGTVIGLGNALGYMQKAVAFTDAGVVITPTELNRTFGGMALSFYTTLLGLLGMLSIAFSHFSLRKRIDGLVTEVSRSLMDDLEGAPNVPAKVQIVAAPSTELLRPLLGAVRTLDESLQKLHRRQDMVTEAAMRCIREDPALYERFGSILFERFVMSHARYEPLSDRLRGTIDAALGPGDHGIKAVAGTTTSGRTCALLLAGANDDDQLCVFDVLAGEPGAKADPQLWPLKGAYDRLLVCDKEAMLLRAEAHAALHWCYPNRQQNTGLRLEQDEHVFPVRNGKKLGGVLIVRGDATDRKVAYLPVGANKVAQVYPQVEGAKWTLASLSEDGKYLALAGSTLTGSRSKLRILEIKHTGGKLLPVMNAKADVDMPDVADLKQISWVSSGFLLLVRKSGELLAFNFDSRQQPGPLAHVQWNRGQDTVAYAGSTTWFAAFEAGHLSMWRVNAGGGLVPAPRADRIPAPGMVSPRVAVSGAGAREACLVGAVGRLVTFWDFPRYRLGDEPILAPQEPLTETE